MRAMLLARHASRNPIRGQFRIGGLTSKTTRRDLGTSSSRVRFGSQADLRDFEIGSAPLPGPQAQAAWVVRPPTTVRMT
jgi:hypothetical protein